MAVKKKKQREPLVKKVNIKTWKLDNFYVLDEDPIKASRSLVMTHIKRYSTIIEEALTYQYLLKQKEMYETKITKDLGIDTRPFIYYSPYNIHFFSTMFQELIKIQQAVLGYYIPVSRKFDPDKMLFNYDLATFNSPTDRLVIPNYLPAILTKHKFSKYKVLGIDNPNNSIMDIHRLMYIIDGYSLDQFPFGAPEWYSPLRREIFRKYDRLSKKTFVIEVDEQGRYRYFFSHISSKLREITSIGDMRQLIDCFLYNG